MRIKVKRGHAALVSPQEKPKTVSNTAPMRGLGDLVAKIADPIAKAVGLNKSKCGCQSRQEWLNHAFPFQRQDSAK